MGANYSGQQLLSVRGFTPQIPNSVFLADNCRIIGDVVIGEKSSVWFNCTLRGDVMPIRVGAETNIQDGSVIHGTYGKYGCTLGSRVTIGHLVMLHGCTIEDTVLVGMGSVIMDGARVGHHSIVGAGSLITEGSDFPPYSLILGRPAKVVRNLRPEEVEMLEHSADNYLLYSTWYQQA